jgi:hypothetical protein
LISLGCSADEDHLPNDWVLAEAVPASHIRRRQTPGGDPDKDIQVVELVGSRQRCVEVLHRV